MSQSIEEINKQLNTLRRQSEEISREQQRLLQELKTRTAHFKRGQMLSQPHSRNYLVVTHVNVEGTVLHLCVQDYDKDEREPTISEDEKSIAILVRMGYEVKGEIDENHLQLLVKAYEEIRIAYQNLNSVKGKIAKVVPCFAY